MPNISTIMHRHVVAIAKSASLETAIKLMKRNRISLLPVVDGEVLIGILEEESVPSGKGSVEEKMKEPFFVLEDDDIDQASKIMLDKHVTRVPVVNNKKEMKLIGIVTSTDVASAIKMGIE